MFGILATLEIGHGAQLAGGNDDRAWEGRSD